MSNASTPFPPPPGFEAGVVTKRKGLTSVLILSKKKSQLRTVHLDPQRLGQSHYNKEIVVINSMNIPKYTQLSGRPTLFFQMEGGEI